MTQYTHVLTSAGLTTSVTAYTSGDVLGTEMNSQLQTGQVATRMTQGYLQGAVIIDKAGVLAATGVDLFIFNAASTPAADNAANSWADADMANCVGVLSVTTIYTSANNRVLTWASPGAGEGVPFRSETGKLWVVAVTRSANGFFTAINDLIYKLFIDLE